MTNNPSAKFNKLTDDPPMYIGYRSMWRVIINGKPYYYDTQELAMNKWSARHEQS